MLVSFVALMEALEPGFTPLTTGDLMQGALFRHVSLLKEEAARALHSDPPAYTISPLLCDHEEVRGARRVIAAGERTWFRVTALQRDAADLMFAMAERTRRWELFTGSARAVFRINHWKSLASEHPWSGQIHPEDLWQSAWAAMRRQPDRIWLDFQTPTGWARNPDAWPEFQNWPSAGAVFSSLERKCRRHLPELGRDMSLRPAEDLLALGQYKVESHALRFERHDTPATGFTGSCEYLLRPDASPAETLRVHFLAGLAFYTGIGAKTSWGMGMARRSRYRDFTYRGVD